MNNEQFESALRMLKDEGYPPLAHELRTRDTAQREAIEAWKAAHAREAAALAQAWEQRDTAQAELAEAVGLLRKVEAINDCEELMLIESFLTRHMQDEQQEAQYIGIQEAWEAAGGNPGVKADREQLLFALKTLDQVCDEAQGAQAGDERELFNRAYEEICNRPITIREIARRMWMARAALATQPAVRKHVAPVSIVTFEKAITEESLAAGFNEPDLSRHEVDGCQVYAQQHIQAAYSGWKMALGLAPAQQAIDLLVEALVAPNTADLPGRIDSFLDSQPAAAHGDEAVLWKLLEELRTATDRQALPGEFIRVMWEAGCDWINARTAMRAQGDGDSGHE